MSSIGANKASVCSNQNPLTLDFWVSPFVGAPSCPEGYLPVRDPATGDWKKLNALCFECSPVSVIDPTTGLQRQWQGTAPGGILPTALNYYAPGTTTKSGTDNTLLILAAVAVGGVFVLSLLRR